MKPWNQKIHWGWYDSTKDKFIISNQRNLWTTTPQSGKVECILSRAEGEQITPEGVGSFDSSSVTKGTVKALINEGIRGFDFLNLEDYGRHKEDSGNVILSLSHALTWGLQGRLSVRHEMDRGNTLSFRERSVTRSGETKKLSHPTHVHKAHPSELSFFTGNNKGEVHWHSFERNSFKRSTKIHGAARTINDLAVSSSGEDLFVAAVGSLSWLKFNGSSYDRISEVQCSPRQIILNDSGTLVVNQGSNGMSVFSPKSKLEEEVSYQTVNSCHMLIPNNDCSMFLSLPQTNTENLTILKTMGGSP